MASIIPFLILLLTAYTFSAPIGQENENSTIEYGLTTGQTTDSMDFISNNLSTAVPIVQKQRSVEDSDSTELSTESVTRSARTYDQKWKKTLGKTPKKSFEKRGGDYLSDSNESESNEKRDSQESFIPTATTGYKKRNDAASQESIESSSSEKRDSKESFIPTTPAYVKRNDATSQESLENGSSEKRESVLPTTTQGYKKRSDAAYQDSLESQSSEKRESEESLVPSTPPYKKRADSASQESMESESGEKRAVNQSVIRPTTSGYKKNTPKSYLFSTLESSTTFNRRAIQPLQSQEESKPEDLDPKQQMSMYSSVKPSSSVNSFGKTTGRPNYEPADQSSAESQSQLPIQSQNITKTVSIFPGKVRKTEFVSYVPSKSSSMMQPAQQEQLSQGQSQSEY